MTHTMSPTTEMTYPHPCTELWAQSIVSSTSNFRIQNVFSKFEKYIPNSKIHNTILYYEF